MASTLTARQALVEYRVVVSKIIVLRGQRVMLAADLAALYDVETKVLMQAVKRNLDRFPADFLFQLTSAEASDLRSQFVTSSLHGGTRYLPYVFTEQGVAMLSSVLRSDRAVAVNIEIMRAFVKMRSLVDGNKEIRQKIARMEAKYDEKFAVVFKAILELMDEKDGKPKRRIGFV